MEKISKEELMEMTGLSEADLAKAAGGADTRCLIEAEYELVACLSRCAGKVTENCKTTCIDAYKDKLMNCPVVL